MNDMGSGLSQVVTEQMDITVRNNVVASNDTSIVRHIIAYKSNEETQQSMNINSLLLSAHGRIDRVILENGLTRQLPQRLSTRPTKIVPFELPFSFVMGPQQISQISTCASFPDLLAKIICLEAPVIQQRTELIQKQKLDHVLMVFTPDKIGVKVASIDGICELLCSEYPEVGRRFATMLPHLRQLSGPENFQARIDAYADYWDQWWFTSNYMWLSIHGNNCPMKIQGSDKLKSAVAVDDNSNTDKDTNENSNDQKSRKCICETYSFDQYCREFDDVYCGPCHHDGTTKTTATTSSANRAGDSVTAGGGEVTNVEDVDSSNIDSPAVARDIRALLVITRKLMYTMLGCNKLYGYDGYTYNASGQATGQEYMAVNKSIERGVVECVFLSEIERFRVI